MANKDPNRVNRIADVMQKYLAVLVRDECSDPRLSKVTISAVEVTNDYAHAKIFFTTLFEDDTAAIEASLNKASGFLRQKLSKLMTLYSVPKLRFVYDPSLANGEKIDKLMSLINSQSVQNNENENE